MVKGVPHLANCFATLADCTYGIGMDMFSNNDPPSSAKCQQEELDTPYDYQGCPRVYLRITRIRTRMICISADHLFQVLILHE